MVLSVSKLIKFIGKNLCISGELDKKILGVNSLALASQDELSFYTGKKYLDDIGKSDAGVILTKIAEELSNQTTFTTKATIIWTNTPRMDFIKTCWKFFPPKTDLGKVIKGHNCTIHPTATLGKCGFGYERGESGRLRNFPHYGNVLLGNEVDVGASSCIDRATFGYTSIGDRTKIDNLVHIAHNVEIGKDCIIVAGTVIGGSVKIGDRVWLGINSSIREGLTIGDDAQIGMGAIVTKDIPAGKVWWIGNPAREYKK